MPKLNAEQAVEFVTNEWIAGRQAEGPTDYIQKGGPGPLLLKTNHSHYKGARIWTDGNTVYSYSTPLLTFVLGGGGRAIKQSPYYRAGDYSPTTGRQIRVINRILASHDFELI